MKFCKRDKKNAHLVINIIGSPLHVLDEENTNDQRRQAQA